MVKEQDSDSYGLKRLESKNARNAIIQKLAVDFNLTPLIAEVFFKQFSLYFEEHANVTIPTERLPMKLLVRRNRLAGIQGHI